jgi:hypothetical protein
MSPGVRFRSVPAALLGFGLSVLALGVFAAGEQRLPLSAFRLVSSVSGPVNYYSLVTKEDPHHIRSDYQPGYDTAVVGYSFTTSQQRATHLSWRWRANVLPRGGNECASGKGDSAAVVYLSWKRGLRYYTLKYVWSAVGPRGAVCDRKRNPLLAQDTIIVESGGPLGEWRSVNLDLRSEFRKHFENGDPNAEVPDLFGVGLMSDGDQTKSRSSADFADFTLR